MKFIPAQFWLLLLVALLAYVPIMNLRRHYAGADREESVVEETQGRAWPAVTNIGILLLLAAFSIFIFTQAAADFANSVQFPSLLVSAIAAYGLWDIANSLLQGTVSPFSRGVTLGPYTHRDQPGRYWVSMAWNTLITVGMIAAAWFLWWDIL